VRVDAERGWFDGTVEPSPEPVPDLESAPTEFTPAVGTVLDDESADVTEEAGEAGTAEPDEPPPRRRPPALLVAGRVLLALVSAATLVATTLLWARVDKIQDSVNTTDALAEAQKQPDAPPPDDGANDILIVGSDTRTDLQGNPLPARIVKQELRTDPTDGTLNTDTLILLRLSRNGGRSVAVSIPRDTSVPAPNLGKDQKINGVFGITKEKALEQMRRDGVKDRAKQERDSDSAGRAALIQSVQLLTGVRIDHYTEVTLYGFYLLTKAIDGVDVCLNHATNDPDSGANFRKGPQTVRGADAVSFVRQRKNLPRGDLDRIVRQQTFLASAMNKVLSGGTLTDTGKLNALADAVSKSVVMDPGLQFLDLVNQAQALANGQVGFVTIPVTGVGARNDRGQSIITVDIPAVKAYIAALMSGTPPPAAPPPPEAPGLRGKPLLNLSGLRAAAYAVPCID
jgi:LCP family protein required for cell wall assembly